jgi:hypothetical protein
MPHGAGIVRSKDKMFTIVKFCQSQAAKPGFAMMKTKLMQHKRLCSLASVMAVCLLLVGSCNTAQVSGILSSILHNNKDIASLSQGQLMRYAYDLQNVSAEDPENLEQFTSRDITLMLAKADLERKDYPSVIWQYRSESCVLDVYFQADDEQDMTDAPVAYYELRERGLVTRASENPVGAWNCLQSLYHERQPVIEAGFRQIYASLQSEGTL